MYVEGTSFAPAVADFLAKRPATIQHEVEAGTLSPKPKVFHLPLSGTNLAELRELAARHAGPEICDHLVVYREGETLLWAHDAGYGDVLVSRDLPRETLSHLEASLGGALGYRR